MLLAHQRRYLVLSALGQVNKSIYCYNNMFMLYLHIDHECSMQPYCYNNMFMLIANQD